MRYGPATGFGLVLPALAGARRGAGGGQAEGGQRGSRGKAGPVGAPVPLRTVAQIMAVLEQAAGDAMALDNSAERCRVLTSLAGQALKAFEVGELEARLEALEQRAKLGRAA